MLRRTARASVRVYQAIVTWLSRIAAGFILVLMFLTTTDVVGRYVFNAPIVGAYEVSQIMLVAIVYLGLAYVQRMKGHVKVDAFTSWAPQRVQWALDAFGYLVAALVVALMTWRSGVEAWQALVTQDHIQGLFRIPFWPGKSLLPLGAGLLCIRLIADVVDSSRRALRGATK